jgi:hypothetical protein
MVAFYITLVIYSDFFYKLELWFQDFALDKCTVELEGLIEQVSIFKNFSVMAAPVACIINIRQS